VILLHGTASSGEVWVSNIGPVAREFHVYSLDQIGFGHSDKPPMDYKIATFVDFLREFMQVIKIPKATLNKKLVSDELVRRVFQAHIQINDIYTIERLVTNRTAEYLGDRVSSIHAPTLLIWGRQDELVPLAAGERYHKAISNHK
jgi:pimeloyl-ACP methyl ester carboxylesterase